MIEKEVDRLGRIVIPMEYRKKAWYYNRKQGCSFIQWKCDLRLCSRGDVCTLRQSIGKQIEASLVQTMCIACERGAVICSM